PVDSFDMARQDPKEQIPSPWSCQPTDADLLNSLAMDFARNKFSLKALMRTITRSSAYQLSARFDGEWKESYTPYFARHFVKQLTAEQLHDSICQATDVFGNYKRNDWTYETPLSPVKYWTETTGPEGVGTAEAKNFMRTFGQSNREQFDRQSGGSILQAMSLMNSPFVNKKVLAENGSRVEKLVKSQMSNQEIVDEMMYRIASMMPKEYHGEYSDFSKSTGKYLVNTNL
ncbi:MAG TPA: DUF1553 domain-containing protein, partial [Anaerolineales bacterium]|nr:DUF1553 domain-containing protein [Anaerolineales bacterium]